MGLDPLVLPNRVLHAAGHRPRGPQAPEQLDHVGAGHLGTVGQAPLQLCRRPLVHVAHGAAHRCAVPVHQHQPLHLGAKGQCGHLLRCRRASGKDGPGGPAHGAPPLLRVLLRAAALQKVQTVARLGAGQQGDLSVDAEQAGLDAGGADIIGQHIAHALSSLAVVFSYGSPFPPSPCRSMLGHAV